MLHVFQMDIVIANLALMAQHVPRVCNIFKTDEELFLINFILDKGCHLDGVLGCNNNGSCLTNGNCACKLGYSGLTCSLCLFLDCFI